MGMRNVGIRYIRLSFPSWSSSTVGLGYCLAVAESCQKIEMKDNIKNILGVSLAVGVIVFAFSAWVFAKSFLKSSDPARTFNVSAEGEVVAIPDIAEFTYSVISEGGEDIVALQRENTQKANRINEYLKTQSVEDKDIKTTSYGINPRYQYYPCPVGTRVCPPSEIVGYSIYHSVVIKVRDLSRVGELLSGVVENGANSASGLTFSIDDLDKVQSQARDIAIQKAGAKAKATAASAGVRLGKIVSIDESFYTPFYQTRALAEGFDGDSFVPSSPAIEPGSQEIKVSVSVRYEIR